MQDLTIGIVGSGGDGVVSGGEALIAAAASLGYHGMMTKSFGPQIRGGESSCRVRLSTERVHNPGGALHAVVVEPGTATHLRAAGRATAERPRTGRPAS